MANPQDPQRPAPSVPAAETSRRDFVRHALGGVAAVALAAACDDDAGAGVGGGADGGDAGAGDGGVGDAGGDSATADVTLDTPVADGEVACTLYPQQTEGPFYLDLEDLRRDVTDGRPGTPLVLVVTVVDAAACAPLRDVAVDIWHCDADGRYSGYPNQLGGVDTTGQRFLRGTQVTDDAGRAQFDTIYPGWYPGRTTHIHFKVHVSSTREATSQLYFPEDVNAAVYEVEPYAARGQKDTTNTADGVNRGNVPPLAAVTEEGDGYRATLTVAVVV